jgi:transcription elongation factor GreA
VARALIGKKKGDTATVRSPGGEKEFDIEEIRFEDPPDDDAPHGT